MVVPVLPWHDEPALEGGLTLTVVEPVRGDVGELHDALLQDIGGQELVGLEGIDEQPLHVEQGITVFVTHEIQLAEGGTAIGGKGGIGLGLHELLDTAELGDAVLAYGVFELVDDVVFTGVGLAPREDAVGILAALIDLEGFVLEFRAYPTSQVLVFEGLVLMEDADEAAVLLAGDVHEALDDVLGHDSVVDVVDKVADTVQDDEVGLEPAHGNFQQREAFLPEVGTDVEDMEPLQGEVGHAGHGHDPVVEDVLGGFLGLLGVEPQDTEGCVFEAADGEHFLAEAEGHEDGADKGLAALGLAGYGYQLATGETGLAEHLEKELHRGYLLLGGDATFFQSLEQLELTAVFAGMFQFTAYVLNGFVVHLAVGFERHSKGTAFP